VFDVICPTDPIKGMTSKHGDEAGAILRQAGELNTVISQYGMDFMMALTKECYNIIETTVDMKSGEKGHSQFNHMQPLQTVQ